MPFFDIFCVSKVITTAHAHHSGVIFHFFPRALKQKNEGSSTTVPCIMFEDDILLFSSSADPLTSSQELTHAVTNVYNWHGRRGLVMTRWAARGPQKKCTRAAALVFLASAAARVHFFFAARVLPSDETPPTVQLAS